MKTAPSFLFAFLAFAGFGFSQENDGLSDAERAQLQRDKVLVGTDEFQQSFEPYIENQLPVFITSDAVLNAFHVLFEESMARVEAANAPKLEALLQRIVKALPQVTTELKGADKWKPGSVQRAEVMIKTALRLLGRPAPGSNAAAEKIIAAQVKEIEAGTGSRKPEWLGPPDAGFLALDFTRYAPRGFYARSAPLQRYFRAVAWLQSVPFRMLQPEEFLAMRMIGRATAIGQPNMAWEYAQREPFMESWKALTGRRDDLDLMSLLEGFSNAEELNFSGTNIREQGELYAEEARKKRNQPLINDTLRFPPGDPAAEADPEYRLVSAAALPDAIMLARTSLASGAGAQRYPDTLEVAAGLGSAFATKTLAAALPGEVWKNMQPSIQWLGKLGVQGCIYDEYLGVLREIVNAPERDAPDFLRGEAWQRKSCQTLLASWTQMRHALVLQAKTNQFFAAETEVPPGFVEPDPEFFRRLGELTQRCMAFFGDAGAWDDNSAPVILDSLYRARDNAAALHKTGESGIASESYDIDRALKRIPDHYKLPEYPESSEREDDTTDEAFEKMEQAHQKEVTAYYAKLRDSLNGVIQKIEKAEPAKQTALLAEMHLMEMDSMATRWLGLAKMCSQAQSIAHRQLRKVPLTKEEDEFIKNFGFLLASAMFYDGNSYEAPRDDAPRVVDVFSGPQGHLHAGTGRPRVLYVLYPLHEKEILCVGSVLPYYEFKHGPERLTDAAWMDRLGKDAPMPPAWLQPILRPPSEKEKK